MPRTLHTRLGRMKTNIFCFILIALLGITISTSIAQQNGDDPKTETEVETLQKRISELEDKLKVVENVEKMELAAKLADANTKLINSDFNKLKSELKDSNQQWLMTWIFIFLGVLSVVGSSIGYAVWSRLTRNIDNLIADRVEESLDGFKEAFDQVIKVKDELGILEKEHAASILEQYPSGPLIELGLQPARIKTFTEEVFLNIFGDKTRDLPIRYKAIEVLASRKSPLLVSPVLNYLNSIVDTEIDWGGSPESERYPFLFLNRLARIHNEESYQGIKNFLNRLIEEKPKNKDLFLTWTVFKFADLGREMKIKESVVILKKAIPNLKDLEQELTRLDKLVENFAKFDEHEGIKDILRNGLTDNFPYIEKQCLNLLEKYDPEFVSEWNEIKAANRRTENEETDESEPTT